MHAAVTKRGHFDPHWEGRLRRNTEWRPTTAGCVEVEPGLVFDVAGRTERTLRACPRLRVLPVKLNGG